MPKPNVKYSLSDVLKKENYMIAKFNVLFKILRQVDTWKCTA